MKTFSFFLLTTLIGIAKENCKAKYLLVEADDVEEEGTFSTFFMNYYQNINYINLKKKLYS